MNAKPWNTVINTLHSLESGLLASEELVKDFLKPTVDKNTGKVRKTDAMENYAMVRIISLAETAVVELKELMRYRLTEICLSLFNINDQMRKAVKSTVINSFEMHETALEGASYILIVDMGFISRLTTQ